jgi:hypothetical protein
MRVARMQFQGAPEQEVRSSSHNKLWTAADVSGWLVKTMRDGQLLRREDIEAVQTHFAGGISSAVQRPCQGRLKVRLSGCRSEEGMKPSRKLIVFRSVVR